MSSADELVKYKLHSSDPIKISDIYEFSYPLMQNYFWHKDSFHLIQVSDHLIKGQTNVGDALQDEWFIVYLLYQISFKFQNLCIQVTDEDGEFLLIEAAQVLPSWLDPVTAPDRIFIHANNLHIIPPEYDKAGSIIKSTLKHATSLITAGDSTKTCASLEIQKILHRKIYEYPQKAKLDLHRCRVMLPPRVAHILYHDPFLIAGSVHTFYNRDLDLFKVCQKMETFGKDNNLVEMTVTMTRMMYAQLISAKVKPPRFFQIPPESSTEFNAFDLGMKIVWLRD
jgi:hypothetical protein